MVVHCNDRVFRPQISTDIHVNPNSCHYLGSQARKGLTCTFDWEIIEIEESGELRRLHEVEPFEDVICDVLSNAAAGVLD